MKTRSKFTVSSIVALLACPCHIPIFALILSGTALGGMLVDYQFTLIAIFSVIFLAAVHIAVKAYKVQQQQLLSQKTVGMQSDSRRKQRD